MAMKITALKQQIRNPERVSVFVDQKYSFSLTLSQVLSNKLVVGKEISDEELSELKQASTDEKLRLKALNWVLLRPRSVKELQNYLRRIEFAKNRNNADHNKLAINNTDLIVEEFLRRGWVNDEVFARWWVSRSTRITKSRSFVSSELLQKGVDREVINLVLESKDDDEVLSELITKLKSKSKFQDEQKLVRYLISKGFRYSSIVAELKTGAVETG